MRRRSSSCANTSRPSSSCVPPIARVRTLGLLPLGEIEVRADDAHDRAAGLAADRKPAREHVDVVAVLVPQAELALVGRRPARDALVELVGARPVVGMEQPLPGADVRLDLVVGVAEHLASTAASTPRAPVSRFQSQTPSCAPANASVSRSSLSRSAASARLRSVRSRWVPTMRTTGPPARGGPESRARARGRSGRPCAGGGTPPRRSRSPRATRVVRLLARGSCRRDAADAPRR